MAFSTNHMFSYLFQAMGIYEQSEEAQLEAAIKASLEAGEDQPTAIILSDSDDDGRGHHVANTRNAHAQANVLSGNHPMATRFQTRHGTGRSKSARMDKSVELRDDDETDHPLANSSDYSPRDEESTALSTTKGKQPVSRKRKMPTRRSKRKRGRTMEEDADNELTTESPKSSPPHLEMLSSTTAGIVGSTARLTIDGSSPRFGRRSMPIRSVEAGSSSLPHRQAGKRSGNQAAVEEAHLLIRFPDGERVAQSFPSNSTIEVCGSYFI